MWPGLLRPCQPLPLGASVSCSPAELHPVPTPLPPPPRCGSVAQGPGRWAPWPQRACPPRATQAGPGGGRGVEPGPRSLSGARGAGSALPAQSVGRGPTRPMRDEVTSCRGHAERAETPTETGPFPRDPWEGDGLGRSAGWGAGAGTAGTHGGSLRGGGQGPTPDPFPSAEWTVTASISPVSSDPTQGPHRVASCWRGTPGDVK